MTAIASVVGSLTANLRSESERSEHLGPHGVDTVAYAFRPGWPGFTEHLMRTSHKVVGGATTAPLASPWPQRPSLHES